jgi:hypothetical protein
VVYSINNVLEVSGGSYRQMYEGWQEVQVFNSFVVVIAHTLF